MKNGGNRLPLYLSEWARFVSLTTCSFLTPPTRKPYKRQSASPVLHLVSRVSASFRHFCVQSHVRLQSTSRKCPAAAKEERDSAREEPNAIAKCSGTTSRASPRQVKECCRKFWDWPNFSIFSLPSAVSLVAAASSASPDSSTRKLVVCSRLAQK